MSVTPNWFLIGLIMEEQIQKSCWGVTAKAMVGFGIIFVVASFLGIA